MGVCMPHAIKTPSSAWYLASGSQMPLSPQTISTEVFGWTKDWTNGLSKVDRANIQVIQKNHWRGFIGGPGCWWVEKIFIQKSPTRFLGKPLSNPSEQSALSWPSDFYTELLVPRPWRPISGHMGHKRYVNIWTTKCTLVLFSLTIHASFGVAQSKLFLQGLAHRHDVIFPRDKSLSLEIPCNCRFHLVFMVLKVYALLHS